MTAETGTQLPPPVPPGKMPPWVIAVLVIILICCFCIGLTGLLLAFGPDILHELGLTAWLPGLRTLL